MLIVSEQISQKTLMKIRSMDQKTTGRTSVDTEDPGIKYFLSAKGNQTCKSFYTKEFVDLFCV